MILQGLHTLYELAHVFLHSLGPALPAPSRADGGRRHEPAPLQPGAARRRRT
jgi:hypothetical protein